MMQVVKIILYTFLLQKLINICNKISHECTLRKIINQVLSNLPWISTLTLKKNWAKIRYINYKLDGAYRDIILHLLDASWTNGYRRITSCFRHSNWITKEQQCAKLARKRYSTDMGSRRVQLRAEYNGRRYIWTTYKTAIYFTDDMNLVSLVIINYTLKQICSVGVRRNNLRFNLFCENPSRNISLKQVLKSVKLVIIILITEFWKNTFWYLDLLY